MPPTHHHLTTTTMFPSSPFPFFARIGPAPRAGLFSPFALRLAGRWAAAWRCCVRAGRGAGRGARGRAGWGYGMLTGGRTIVEMSGQRVRFRFHLAQQKKH